MLFNRLGFMYLLYVENRVIVTSKGVNGIRRRHIIHRRRHILNFQPTKTVFVQNDVF